jgi:lipoprotein-anchoring transpeptidase ErfK/SrfK
MATKKLAVQQSSKVCIKPSTIQARVAGLELRTIPVFVPANPVGSLTSKCSKRKCFVPNFSAMFHSMLRVFLPLCWLIVALLIGGCEETGPSVPYLGGTYGGAPTGQPQDTVSYWDGDGIGGKPSVKISLGEQRAYFYRSGLLVGVSQLSTGREGLITPTGHFSIIQKDINHVSTKYGDFVDDAGNVVKPNVSVDDKKPPGTHFKGAPMPYFMRIVDGVGMHAGYLPGYPASHGCIRMPEFMAENFFKSISTGTPVTITN